MSSSDEHFTMGEPQAIGVNTRFAFHLSAFDPDLFAFVKTLICVAGVIQTEAARALVEIKDSYDPDEVWHWIRTRLEEEAQTVQLDKIWEDAIAWLL